MPRIAALEGLYQRGLRFRQGEMTMLAGRSGSGKSAFMLWLAANWNVPTLYMSADMSGFEASTRLASMLLIKTNEQIEEEWKTGGRATILQTLAPLQLTFAFGNPITLHGLGAELLAFIELHGIYPKVMVIDNVMDIEGCDTEYAAQMSAMQELAAICRTTGSSVFALHHATDKSRDAEYDPFSPPSRSEIKNGLCEKPQLVLSVGLNPNNNEFRVSVVKQRSGPADPTAKRYTTLQAEPKYNTFRTYSVRHLQAVD
jgi:hypothetical protein